MTSRDPYAAPRLATFWFLAVAVGLVALGALALLVWALSKVVPHGS